MLTHPVTALATAAATAAALIVLSGPARADGGDPTVSPPEDCGSDAVCWDVKAPGSGGSGHDTRPAGSGSSSKPKCVAAGDPVPCTDPDFGSFSGGCYYKKADPQPPADDPAWQGHSPDKGAIYQKTCLVGGGISRTFSGLVWLADAPGGAVVDPAQLAQEALGKMTLKAAEIHVTPEPGKRGVVGLPTWVWTPKTAERWGPQSASASAGGVTVTVTATVQNIRWSMGDGSGVTCAFPGKPYRAAYGKRLPDKGRGECGTDGYAKPSGTRPHGTYTVTATSTWGIDWEGGGENGQLTETRQAQVQVTVDELQVLN